LGWINIKRVAATNKMSSEVAINGLYLLYSFREEANFKAIKPLKFN